MKTIRKVGALLLVTMMISTISAMAVDSKGDQIAASALDEVINLYADVYTISDASANLVGQETDDSGNIAYVVEMSFKRTLKETDATQIPAIRGMLEAKNKLKDPAEILAAETYIDARIADMNDNYIGVAQDTNVTVRVTLPAMTPYTALIDGEMSSDAIKVESEFDGNAYTPLEGIAPRSASEQMDNANALIAEVVSVASSMNLRATPHNSALLSYDRVKARDYARNWSCTKGTVGAHSSCHNPDYTYFEGASGTDCTNFVSQCIHEGGLPTDNTWKPYTSAWTTTGNNGSGIRQYVVNNDLFFRTTNVDKAYAGSIINLLNSNGTNAGHVGLIDQNDFYTVTLCAHDSCRKSYPVSNWGNKNYYVPYYDSHGGVWVEP